MKINLEKIKDFFQKFDFRNFFSSLLFEKIGWFILVFFLLVGAYAVFIWYAYVFDSDWDDMRKQEYAKTRDKGTTFNKGRFEEIVKEFRNRQERYRETPAENPEDIFRLKD